MQYNIFIIIEYHNSTMNKNSGDCLIWKLNGYKAVNKYPEVLTLQKYIWFKLHYVLEYGNIQIITIQQ